MLLTAAIVLLLIALFTQSEAWDGFGMLVYFLGVGVAVVGWGFNALSTVLPVVSGWGGVLLSLVTGPLGLPVWQSLVIGTILFFVAIATADTESSTSSSTTDSASPASDSAVVPNVEELPGIGEQKAAALRDAGYEDANDILAASKAELTTVDGIGTALAARLIVSVEDRYEESNADGLTAVESDGSTNGAGLSSGTESPDQASDDTATLEMYTDREKLRLVAGLEATCDRIETLVATGEVAEANDRIPAMRAAASETREALTTLSGDRDLRLRVNDVEDRLDAIPSEAEAQYDKVVSDGDAHVTTAQDAVETGDVDTGLEACKNAHAAYRAAQDVGQSADAEWFAEEEATVYNRIETVESLTDRLEHEKQVQQAEETINTLTQRGSSLKETSQLGEAEDVMQSVVEDGKDALERLPDNITASELEHRVAHLREQVAEFESVADQLAAQSSSTPPTSDTEARSLSREEPGDKPDSAATATEEPQNVESAASEQPSEPEHDAAESRSFVRTVDKIDETAQHSTPVVLQIREHLTEDGRRHVFRAVTVDGESVQLDVWNRHICEFNWESGAWYVFESVRGQHWTVNGETGVTVSTTPNTIVTQRESIPNAEATTG
ncbi:helix-hairpin-helix domain-containing protein [Halorubrum lipolyticum]|uniref:helix-hairpin-helix domain-containing protein n=1 Tax=Halorubrum lipolyticum TaxID=368624 RepID=UPI0019D32964|nr:helix-hairpin-helix domain-containing protein [Halorubrum lipolyticum]